MRIDIEVSAENKAMLTRVMFKHQLTSHASAVTRVLNEYRVAVSGGKDLPGPRLPFTSREVFYCLQKSETPLTIAEVRESVGCSLPGTTNAIKQLLAMGKIEEAGYKRTALHQGRVPLTYKAVAGVMIEPPKRPVLSPGAQELIDKGWDHERTPYEAEIEAWMKFAQDYPEIFAGRG